MRAIRAAAIAVGILGLTGCNASAPAAGTTTPTTVAENSALCESLRATPNGSEGEGFTAANAQLTQCINLNAITLASAPDEAGVVASVVAMECRGDTMRAAAAYMEGPHPELMSLASARSDLDQAVRADALAAVVKARAGRCEPR